MCGRRFSSAALEKHSRACQKVFQAKRKVMRLASFDAPSPCKSSSLVVPRLYVIACIAMHIVALYTLGEFFLVCITQRGRLLVFCSVAERFRALSAITVLSGCTNSESRPVLPFTVQYGCVSSADQCLSRKERPISSRVSTSRASGLLLPTNDNDKSACFLVFPLSPRCLVFFSPTVANLVRSLR